MATDALQLISRVLERAAEKYAAQAGIPGLDGAVLLSEDGVVDMLAAQLLGFFGVRQAAAAIGPEPTGEDLTAFFDELAKRNHRLATAVGACDCWGEVPGCALCAGEGGPGWLMPHKDSFDVVVRPALHKLSTYRTAVRHGQM